MLLSLQLPTSYLNYSFWINHSKALEADSRSERFRYVFMIIPVFKGLKHLHMDQVWLACQCWGCQVFFQWPVITLHHSHSCGVATNLSPGNMSLFIIWLSFGRRLSATPGPWFTPQCVRVCEWVCVSSRWIYEAILYECKELVLGLESVPRCISACNPVIPHHVLQR